MVVSDKVVKLFNSLRRRNKTLKLVWMDTLQEAAKNEILSRILVPKDFFPEVFKKIQLSSNPNMSAGKVEKAGINIFNFDDSLDAKEILEKVLGLKPPISKFIKKNNTASLRFTLSTETEEQKADSLSFTSTTETKDYEWSFAHRSYQNEEEFCYSALINCLKKPTMRQKIFYKLAELQQPRSVGFPKKIGQNKNRLKSKGTWGKHPLSRSRTRDTGYNKQTNPQIKTKDKKKSNIFIRSLGTKSSKTSGTLTFNRNGQYDKSSWSSLNTTSSTLGASFESLSNPYDMSDRFPYTDTNERAKQKGSDTIFDEKNIDFSVTVAAHSFQQEKFEIAFTKDIKESTKLVDVSYYTDNFPFVNSQLKRVTSIFIVLSGHDVLRSEKHVLKKLNQCLTTRYDRKAEFVILVNTKVVNLSDSKPARLNKYINQWRKLRKLCILKHGNKYFLELDSASDMIEFTKKSKTKSGAISFDSWKYFLETIQQENLLPDIPIVLKNKKFRHNDKLEQLHEAGLIENSSAGFIFDTTWFSRFLLAFYSCKIPKSSRNSHATKLSMELAEFQAKGIFTTNVIAYILREQLGIKNAVDKNVLSALCKILEERGFVAKYNFMNYNEYIVFQREAIEDNDSNNSFHREFYIPRQLKSVPGVSRKYVKRQDDNILVAVEDLTYNFNFIFEKNCTRIYYRALMTKFFSIFNDELRKLRSANNTMKCGGKKKKYWSIIVKNNFLQPNEKTIIFFNEKYKVQLIWAKANVISLQLNSKNFLREMYYLVDSLIEELNTTQFNMGDNEMKVRFTHKTKKKNYSWDLSHLIQTSNFPFQFIAKVTDSLGQLRKEYQRISEDKDYWFVNDFLYPKP